MAHIVLLETDNLSELIDELTKVKNSFGDLPVKICPDDDFYTGPICFIEVGLTRFGAEKKVVRLS